MTLHRLFIHNWRWKAFSILLASGIWFFVAASLRNEVVVRKNPLSQRAEFQSHVPVGIFSTSGATAGFRIDPAEVDVTIRGDFAALQDLDWKLIRAWVDVSALARNGQEPAAVYERLVEVHGPPGVEIVRIEPAAVNVRRSSAALHEKLIAPSDNP